MKARLLLVSAILSVAIVGCTVARAAGVQQVVATAAPTAALAPAGQEPLAALYQQVIPGVVIVKVSTTSGHGLGSGFVYDAEGHIVTNYHVVEGATNSKVEVDFMNGYKAWATVVGTDLDSDLAVVKVDAPASELHPLPLGDSDQLQIGQGVVAIGNPFVFFGSMSSGIVSALHRTLDSSHQTPEGGTTFTAGDLIQTDTSINPGNSGGPLFNLQGEIIGVNRAIETTQANSNGQPVSDGVGFAISSNIIKHVVPGIIKDGKYDYPWIGISSLSLGNPSRGGMTLGQIEALGIKQFTGIYITAVSAGSPAEKAGIKAGTDLVNSSTPPAGGDLIVSIDGKPVIQYDDLLAYLITQKSPGETITLGIIRDGNPMDVQVTLGKRP